MVYDQPFPNKNISTSNHGMKGWMIWMRVRLDVTANQATGEAFEAFLVFVGPRTDLASVAFRPYFD